MQYRQNALNEWVKTTLNSTSFEMRLLAGDASFRRYWRITTPQHTYVLMDAPPDKEKLEPFIDVDEALLTQKIHTPHIYAKDLTLGALLLEDFGDTQLLSQLNTNTYTHYYRQAMRILGPLAACNPQHFEIPVFDKAHMMQEMQLFIDWYWKRHLGLSLTPAIENVIKTAFEWISNTLTLAPKVFIHRDYHSRNLMCIEQEGIETLGVIDFQDAMLGPIGYDLVSLLKDCYIALPKNFVLNEVEWFYSHIDNQNLSFEQFLRTFELCGIQRHLKVLGIFCRLNYRDGKSNYLNDLPLTLNYLTDALEGFTPLSAFLDLIKEHILCRLNLQSS